MSLPSSWKRAAWRWAWIPFVAACTGTTVIPSGDGGSAGSTGSGGGPISTSTVPPTTTNPLCVDLDPSTYDQSCQSDSDCALVPVGTYCEGYTCSCPSGTVSNAAVSQYEAAFAVVQPAPDTGCECPLAGGARCIAGTCTFCPVSFVDGGDQLACPVDGG
jgi:hypothetical protein